MSADELPPMRSSGTRPPRTLGGVHETFWEYCGKGELRLQRCNDCQHITWPATEACESCGGKALSWEKMSGRGQLVSWCTFERDYYGGMLPMPWDTILVELEEGVMFISNPEGFSNDEAEPGMSVEVHFVECEDKNGAFKLPVFKPNKVGV